MISCAVSIAFEVEGDYASFDEIPRDVVLAALRQRVSRLTQDPDPDAFDCYDTVSL